MDYFDAAKEALEFLRKAAFGTDPPARFVAMTSEEVNDEIRRLTVELEQQIVMMLVASFEAVFQLDAQDRIQRKQKDAVSKRLRKLMSSKPARKRGPIDLEQILDFWKREIKASRGAIGQFTQLLLYRHWLAHGRYWHQRSGLPWVDPIEANNRGRAALAACGIA
jgi:hypothetical protein